MRKPLAAIEWQIAENEADWERLQVPSALHVTPDADPPLRPISASWQPVMAGLRLWQVWDMDLPLAEWQEGDVHWIYLDLPGGSSDQPVILPEQYEELCAAHARWMTSPSELGLPLLCVELDWEVWYLGTWGPRHPPTRLTQIVPPAHDSFTQDIMRLRGQTVALATLVEYAVVTYGRERLPALVAGLGQYKSWATLIPAVFDVSAAEFEAGWQAYLAAHYGLSLKTVVK